MTTKEELLSRKLGEAIARKRLKKELTQEQVADTLGIGNEAVSRMERGIAPPSVYRLHELAEIFDCGVEEFLIESSRRTTDQVEHLNKLLGPLLLSDRQLVIGIVEQLSARLRKEKQDRRGKNDDGQ